MRHASRLCLFSISENVRDRLGYKELKSKCDLQSRIDKWSFSRGFSKHIFDSCDLLILKNHGLDISVLTVCPRTSK